MKYHFTPPAIPEDEGFRLRSLHQLDVLDTGPEAGLDALVKAASLVCQVPISLISLVDAHRQWFKAREGLEICETSRDISFCGHAILSDELFEVNDALNSPLFAHNPMVTGEPGIRFYAGVPLKTRAGARVGTLCVLDRVPKQLNDKQRHVLKNLAIAATVLLESSQQASLFAQRIQKEESVSELRNQLAAIVQYSGDAILSKTLEGIVTSWNQGAQRIFGYSESEMLGQSINRLFPDDRLEEEKAFLARLRQGQAIENFETVRKHKSGALVHVSVSLSPLFSADGHVIGIAKIGHDISHRFAAAAAEKAAESHYTALMDAMYEGVIHQLADGSINAYNQSAERLLGLSYDQMVGRKSVGSTWRCVHEDMSHWPGRLFPARVALATGQPVRDEVMGVYRPDGQLTWISVNSKPLFEEGNAKPVSVITSFVDVTKSKSVERLLAQREKFLQVLTNSIPGMVGYWDKDLRCGFANKAYQQWFGRSPEMMLGTTMQDVLGERIFALNEPYIRGALAGHCQSFERTLTRADGSVGHSWANYVPDVDAEGKVVGFFVLVTDVTPLKEAQGKLKLAASVIEHTNEGVMVTDENGVILSVNPAFTQITGYSPDDAIGHTPRLLKSHRHDAEFYAKVWHAMRTEGQWQGEIWNRKKSGEIFLEWQTITKIAGSELVPDRYISLFHDITESWHKDERIRHLAFHDALTELPNRALLIDRLNQQIAQSERQSHVLAVMFLDLDRFKFVNDTLGHEVGDQLLKVVAQRLLAVVRHSDTVARLGGDEFVVMLNNPANQGEVVEIAQRIILSINDPMEFAGKTAQVGTSIGIVMYPSGGQTPAELLKNADTAMYAAKTGGRNTYRFFDAESSGTKLSDGPL